MCHYCNRRLLYSDLQVDVFDNQHLATPLFCASVCDDPSGIETLLAHSADINAGLHEYGVSALHCAVRANATDNVRILLENRSGFILLSHSEST